MIFDEFIDLLENVKPSGTGYMARCPAHEDGKQSLQVSEQDDGNIGVHCHANCATEEVMEALGLEMKDLFSDSDQPEPEEEQAMYYYNDIDGVPLYRVVRNPGKKFHQERYVPASDSYVPGMDGVSLTIYRLDEVLAAAPSKVIFVVEGEKDVEALRSLGSVATCNTGGAGKWRDEYAQFFRGRFVRIVADKDAPGEGHAREVRDSLRGVAKSVEIVQAASGKDAADHVSAGHAAAAFVPLSGILRSLDLSKPPPPTDWVLEDFIALGDVVLFSSAPGLGKSWWSMGLTVAITEGHTHFLGKRVMTAGRVLTIDEENPEDVVYSRLRRLGLSHYENLRYVWNRGIRLDRNPEHLIAEVIEYRPQLVIIDSLTRVHSKEENSVGEMGPILNDVIRPMARETGAAVILIHHHDKSNRGPRGSGDILASVDTAIDLYDGGEPGCFGMKLTKSRRTLTGNWSKIRIKDMPGGVTRLETY